MADTKKPAAKATAKNETPAKAATKKEAEPKKEKAATEKSNVQEGASMDAAKEISQKALDATKDAAMGAFQAATVVVTDPMGGQSKAMKALGPSGSLAAGIFFTVLFVLIGYLANMGGGFGNHLKMIGLHVVLPAALAACFWGLGQLREEKISIGGAIFSAGVTLFPLTVVFLIFWVNIFSGWISGLVFLYGFSIMVLLIAGYLMDVLKYSTQRAVVMAPTVLAATLAITYLYGYIVWGRMPFMGMPM